MTWDDGIALASVAPKARAGALKGVYYATEHVKTVAQSRAPHEDGDLERSAVASQDDGGADIRGAVSFDTPYAVAQHEELGWEHDAGRQAKFLESAFASEKNTIKSLIAREVRARLGT